MAAPAKTLATTPRTTTRPPRPIVYPTSDGKPMAETELHGDTMIYLREALKTFFARPGQPLAQVGSNNFLFWQEGDPHKKVSPDVYVVFGVAQRSRDSYKAWEEGGHLPAVVFEITSGKTRREDAETKLTLYERTLHVPEYFQYDPRSDYLNPRLRGHRLDENGVYQPIPLVNNRLHSQQLNLDLVLDDDGVLRLYDLATQTLLPAPQEQAALAFAAQIRADNAQARAEDAEERAEDANRRAQAEAERAEAAETELARLRARLAALENTNPASE